VLDGLWDPLTRCFDAESTRRVSELRIDPTVQSRIDSLAERANEGVLSEEERAEYPLMRLRQRKSALRRTTNQLTGNVVDKKWR